MLSLGDFKSSGLQNHLYADNLPNSISAFIIPLSSGGLCPTTSLTSPLIGLIGISNFTYPEQHWLQLPPLDSQLLSTFLHHLPLSINGTVLHSGDQAPNFHVTLSSSHKPANNSPSSPDTFTSKTGFFLALWWSKIIIFINYLPLGNFSGHHIPSR